jgi:hypothetical protein
MSDLYLTRFQERSKGSGLSAPEDVCRRYQNQLDVARARAGREQKKPSRGNAQTITDVVGATMTVAAIAGSARRHEEIQENKLADLRLNHFDSYPPVKAAACSSQEVRSNRLLL